MGFSSEVTNLYPALAALDPVTLQVLGQGATAWVKQYLSRELDAGSYTEYFSGQNQPLLFLSNSPVLEVTQVEIMGPGQYTNTYTMDSNYYSWTPDGVLHITPQGFWNQLPGWRPGVGNIVVSYTSAGFDQPTQDMILGAVMNWFLDQNKRSATAAGETIGAYSYTMRTDFKMIPPAISAVLYPFKHIRAS